MDSMPSSEDLKLIMKFLLTSSSKDAAKPIKDTEDHRHPFHFPFQPYDIQVDLMKIAYETYETSSYALLESPTGTGKSLSLICSSLSWLVDNRKRLRQTLTDKRDDLTVAIQELKKEEEISQDWLHIQTKLQKLNRELVDITKHLEKIDKIEARREARRHAKIHGLLLEDYSSINENDDKNSRLKEQNVQASPDKNLISKIPEESGCDPELEDEESLERRMKEESVEFHIRPKVYYASKTHSQLTQFINEVKKTEFANSRDSSNLINLTPLASRANLCINQDVVKLNDPSAINEKCSELQRETNKSKRCTYLKSKEINLLKEDILSSVQDIEDIVKRGKTLGACPYYATRIAVPEAEMVILPYNNLLHHDTRKASSLDLKDSIVIVDEAHNILETICAIHSASISGKLLLSSHTILSRYYNKFHSRMSPRNAEIIKSIVLCLTNLIRYLDSPKKHIDDYDKPHSVHIDEKTPQKDTPDNQIKTQPRTETRLESYNHELMLDVAKFIGVANIERFNIFKIIDYFSRSQLARKLIGFFRQNPTLDISIELDDNLKDEINENSILDPDAFKSPVLKKRKTQNKKISARDSGSKLTSTSLKFLIDNNPELKKSDTDESNYPIYILVEFLRTLANLAIHGKVLTNYINSDIRKSSIKFILLNPSSQFEQMTKEAKSIVLAGGTMQPVNEFFNLLFEPLKIERKRVKVFSCGHVISNEQLYISSLSQSSSGKPLELSFKTKNDNNFIDVIGETVCDIASIVPAGMICFFPSYEYEQICYDRWKRNSTISKIETKWKQLFREPRNASQSKEELDNYSRAVTKWKSSGRGAMLFCVVGGKMSEGINFNDDLGRCVVMIGLPYANIRSPELQQKMSFYDKTCSKQATKQQISGGQQYYENLCIKGINQSIGRVIRHKHDYASVILLDRRYSTKTSIRNGLSAWMSKSLVDHQSFSNLSAQLKEFYRRMSGMQSSKL